MLPETQVADFVKNYRETLGRQYETAVQSLNQQRLNNQRTLMSNANRMGALYSNFPARDKIIYDQQTYLPNYAKLRQTYQTGFDKFRSDILKYENSMRNIQDAINELNAA